MDQIKNMKVLEQLKDGCYRVLINKKEAQLDIISKRQVLLTKSYQTLRKWIEIQYHISHPNVQKLYFYTHDDENVYVVREYMAHGSLLNWIKYGKVKNLKSIVDQILSVQNYFNQYQMYLEITVENVFFDQNNNVKLSNLSNIKHKSGQMNESIWELVYHCIFGRPCKFYYEIVNDQVVRVPLHKEEQQYAIEVLNQL